MRVLMFDLSREQEQLTNIKRERKLGQMNVKGLDSFFDNITADKISTHREELINLLKLTPRKKLYYITSTRIKVIQLNKYGTIQVDIADSHNKNSFLLVTTPDINSIFTINLIKKRTNDNRIY